MDWIHDSKPPRFDGEPRDLVVRLLAAARDFGVAEDLRLLLGEAAAEVDRLCNIWWRTDHADKT